MFKSLPAQLYLEGDPIPPPPATHTLADFQAAQRESQGDYGYDEIISSQALAIWKESIEEEHLYVRPDILIATLQSVIADHIDSFLHSLREHVNTSESRRFDQWLKYRVKRAQRNESVSR